MKICVEANVPRLSVGSVAVNLAFSLCYTQWWKHFVLLVALVPWVHFIRTQLGAQ